MAKINYSKVEAALASGLTKMNIEELDKLAGVARDVGRPELRKFAEKVINAGKKRALERNAALFVLKQGSRKHTVDSFYEEFKMTFLEVNELLKKGKALSDEDWVILLPIKDKMLLTKVNLQNAHPEFQDEKIVEQNRKDQINSRINIKKTWLPLK